MPLSLLWRLASSKTKRHTSQTRRSCRGKSRKTMSSRRLSTRHADFFIPPTAISQSRAAGSHFFWRPFLCQRYGLSNMWFRAVDVQLGVESLPGSQAGKAVSVHFVLAWRFARQISMNSHSTLIAAGRVPRRARREWEGNGFQHDDASEEATTRKGFACSVRKWNFVHESIALGQFSVVWGWRIVGNSVECCACSIHFRQCVM